MLKDTIQQYMPEDVSDSKEALKIALVNLKQVRLVCSEA